ncbi:cupin domain-containing protein [Agrobacterium rhizogenes]|uniref:cupin domain-containing protein n=1 Tax=Rhizobium rhizogenes TaxID=359 RepID=UPI00103EBFC3|nr:cupin domain-containing protein [Rhizobium rhizogenes]MDJ1635234.1 cupin domain-containing protein [Rhizobium rhizogenes]NTG10663.1 cupin domain-containing protein [Rhizobium rhizogenes]NTG17134.1 cupin domain-containing protein [Rhizobium rhizogenes]NTG30745.1 cupin domain-containing protein [Rhizobium rhizogenes]NTG37583.1 cupin domain-containing protein [Rhizobium rhizogenes]
MTFETRLFDVGMDALRQSHLRNEQVFDLVPGQNKDIWQSFNAEGGVPFYPAPGSTLFRFFILSPPDEALTADDWEGIADQFFTQSGIEHCRVDTSRHPLMHATPTEDCVMLLSGHAQLILDKGEPVELRPFDVVRQRKTNHSWVNLGPGPAVFISLMHGVR